MKSSYRFSFRRFISFVPFVFLLALFITFGGTVLYADTFTVTTLSDDVPGSLRAAIASADSYDDIISFDVTGTITLSSELGINAGMKIQGPGADLLAVSGGGECRVFHIGDTVESVDISGISIVSGDAGSDDGGGIYNKSDKLAVDNCRFSGNQAYKGGGMNNYYCSPNVMGCTFFLNNADYGGGMYNEQSDPEVKNCTFCSNSAHYNGGGMYNFNYSSSTVTNCTFFSNSVGECGGGMNNVIYSSPEVTNCTFYMNRATTYGGGMSNQWQSNPTVTNCIFWESSGGEIYNFPDEMLPVPSIPILSFCVVQNNDVGNRTSSNEIISADPMLQPLDDNGGATWTCALGGGSSAIDAGNTIAEVSTDQRGAPRPFNDGSFDIGAYESGLEVYEITATSSDGGTISPDKARTLAGIEDEVFYLVPDKGYEIEAVYVDDVPHSYDIASNTYTFHNVSKDCHIRADFALKHFTITALSCDNGAITPLTADVAYSDDVTFTISPEEYYYLDHLYVDGNPVSPDEGEGLTYTFENVSADHEISADFRISAADDDDDEDNKVVDDQTVTRDSDGCNISALSGIALLLVLPLLFLSGKKR